MNFNIKNRILRHTSLVAFILLFGGLSLTAQTGEEEEIVKPGGVSENVTVELWLKADAFDASYKEGTLVERWVDYSGHERNFTQEGSGSTNVPKFNLTETMNFQPSVYFDGGTTQLTYSGGSRFFDRADLTYHVFFVSKFTGSGKASLYAYDRYSNRSIGWKDSNPASFQVYRFSYPTGAQNGGGTLDNIHQGNGKKYGINYIALNKAGNPRLIMNGVGNSNSVKTSELKMGEQHHILGYSSAPTGITGTGGSALPYTGHIQEMIVLSTSSSISEVDIAKVNTYLSLKYGVRLGHDTQTIDYVNSDNEVVWSINKAGEFYRDLFGIGRDDKSGLYQKQSTSTDFEIKTLTVYVDELKHLNTLNTGELNDGDYLILGSNGKYKTGEFLTYIQAKGTQYQNAVLEGDLTHINALQFMAQTPVVDGMTVNMDVNVRADYVLVSSTASFEKAKTSIYKVKNGVVRDVLLKDKDYIAFASYAGAPGGISNGLKIWLRADDRTTLTLNDNREVVRWEDYYTSGAHYYQRHTTAPLYVEDDETANYHPSVFFRGKQYLSTDKFPFSTGAPMARTVVLTMHGSLENTDDEMFYPIGFGDTRPKDGFTANAGRTADQPALGVFHRKTVGKYKGYAYDGGIGPAPIFPTSAGFVETTQDLYKDKSTTVMLNELVRETYMRFEFDGIGESLTKGSMIGIGNAERLGKYATMDAAGTLGTGGHQGDKNSMYGTIGEMFAYERKLEQYEKNAIYSYLGLKYGLTIKVKSSDDVNSETLPFDYFLSNRERIVWPGKSKDKLNGKYHNYIAGLVRDDAAVLNNKRSRSTMDGGMVYMSIDKLNTGDKNPSGFDRDYQAIVWGNDAAEDELLLERGDELACGAEARMRRIWMVDASTWKYQDPNNEGSPEEFTPETVTVRVGKDGHFPYSGEGFEVFMLVSDNEADLFAGVLNEVTGEYEGAATGWKQGIKGEFIDGEHQFTLDLNQKYTYFTFAAKNLGGACETCDFKGTKTVNFVAYPKGTKNSPVKFNLGDGFDAHVTVLFEGGANPYNKNYPQHVSGTLQEYRKNASGSWMTTKIELSKAAMANFQIYEIDYRGGLYDYVEITGVCFDSEGNRVEIPAVLSYVMPVDNSSFRIRGNTLQSTSKDVGYNAMEGRANVAFKRPVKEILIRHKSTGSSGLFSSSPKRIGIGAINLKCPQALPPFNSAGFSFTSEAPAEKLLCLEVPYTFVIYNNDCENRKVRFTDVLDKDMVWVRGGVSVDWEGGLKGATVNNYAETRELTIDDLVVPAGSYLTLTARAIFNMDAQAREYQNQAKIEYQYTNDEGTVINEELLSCDAMTTTSCVPTTTLALPVDNRPLPSETDKFAPSISCYEENSEVDITLTINNPNATVITSSQLHIDFSPEFDLVGEITSGTLNLGAPVVEGGEEVKGSYSFEGFDIPGGKHTITFKVKAPSDKNLLPKQYILNSEGEYVVEKDKNGDDVIAPLEVAFDFSADTGDECLDASLTNLNGVLLLPYCHNVTGRDWVISNKNIGKKQYLIK